MNTEVSNGSALTRRVRAVIVNHNTSDLTGACVRSLKLQEYSPLDLVVVDDNSKPSEAEKLNGLTSLGVTLILSKRSTGYARSLNAGARARRLPKPTFVLGLNSDIELRDSHTIEKLIECLDASSRRVAVSPIVNNIRVHRCPHSEVQVRRVPNVFQTIILHSWWLRRVMDVSKRLTSWYTYAEHRPYSPSITVDCETINGACFMVRSDFLKKVGYLDEGTFLYMEELILGARIKGEDKTACLATDTTVDHLQGQSTGFTINQFRGRMFVEQVRSEVHFVRAYHGAGWTSTGLLLGVRAIDAGGKIVAGAIRRLVSMPGQG
jgi:GT2 family glycosyltransferase